MPQVRSNGVVIDYDDEGLGDPALLLMHGWCGTRAAFDPVRGLPQRATPRARLGLARARRLLRAAGDFGEEDLVHDALAVIADSGAQSVVPVALAHAGSMGIDLRAPARPRAGPRGGGLGRERGAGSVPGTLEDVRSDADRDDAVAGLLQQWQAGVPDPALAALLADMGAASAVRTDSA